MSEDSGVFRIAPGWLWVFIVAGAFAVSLIVMTVIASPGRELDGIVMASILLGPMVVVCVYGFISCRAESLEITDDEVVYHKLWGDLRMRRSEISSAVPLMTSIPPWIVIHLSSQKRGNRLPAYFRDYQTWMTTLMNTVELNRKARIPAEPASAPRTLAGMTVNTGVFPIAPSKVWPILVVGTLLIGVGAALLRASALEVGGAMFATLAFGYLFLRAGHLEITPDEVLYHNLWGTRHILRSNISSVSLGYFSFIPFIYYIIQSTSQKRPIRLPGYFREPDTWLVILMRIGLQNTRARSATDA